MKKYLFAFAAAWLLVGCAQEATQQVPKPRIIVTCDPELDDNNSLIRYILYLTDFLHRNRCSSIALYTALAFASTEVATKLLRQDFRREQYVANL